MDTNSRLFHKAQETIAKQASASAPSLTSPSPISGTKMPLDALMDLDPGMSTLLFFSIIIPYGLSISQRFLLVSSASKTKLLFNALGT